MSDTESDPQTDPEAEGGPGGAEGDGNARETDVQESDPNADSAQGLAGGMGVSSERVGDLRGTGGEQGTYGAMDTDLPVPEGDLPPEQSANPATGEPQGGGGATKQRAGSGSRIGPSVAARAAGEPANAVPGGGAGGRLERGPAGDGAGHARDHT